MDRSDRSLDLTFPISKMFEAQNKKCLVNMPVRGEIRLTVTADDSIALNDRYCLLEGPFHF